MIFTMKMANSFVCSTKRKGVGVIEIEACLQKDSLYSQPIEVVDNRSQFLKSEVHHMYQAYPCGFRTPELCSSGVCRWLYPITFGGGLVGGDQINVQFTIGQKCCVVVCTQESTKVYHCLESEETAQSMEFVLKPDCLLCVLPDPLVCYRDANFSQTQTFHLCPSSNLVLLDWIQAGRLALGESWNFQRYCGTIEIYLDKKLVFRECNDLENTPKLALGACMKQFQVMGTCIVLGPYLAAMSKTLLEKYGRQRGFGEKSCQNLVVSVSPLSYCVKGQRLEGCYLRFLATDMRQVSSVITDITKPLIPDLGADPFERKL